MITKRERYLMKQAMDVAEYYREDGVDEWLDEVISDAGHTVEEYLDYHANKYAERDYE